MQPVAHFFHPIPLSPSPCCCGPPWMLGTSRTGPGEWLWSRRPRRGGSCPGLLIAPAGYVSALFSSPLIAGHRAMDSLATGALFPPHSPLSILPETQICSGILYPLLRSPFDLLTPHTPPQRPPLHNPRRVWLTFMPNPITTLRCLRFQQPLSQLIPSTSGPYPT